MIIKNSVLLSAVLHAQALLAGLVNTTTASNTTHTTSGFLPTVSYTYTCLIDNTIDATIYRNIFWDMTSYGPQSTTGLVLSDWCPFAVTTSGTMIWGTASYSMNPASTVASASSFASLTAYSRI